MVTVHHLNNSRSQRILWMLEELGVEYEVKRYERDSKTNLAPEELRKVHPLGKSPVITDGDITVAESGAIIEYIAYNYGKKSIPRAGTAKHRDYTYWMHYSEGTLMPLLVLNLIMDRINTAPMPFFVKPIAKKITGAVLDSYILPNLQSNIEYIEEYLDGKTWFVGDTMTGADVQMIFPLEAMVSQSKRMSACPNIRAYVSRIHQMETYQKALKEGGPYDYA